MKPIDIVIPWVDDSDEEWKAKKARYSIENNIMNAASRYRDFGILKYALRSIEMNIPWVRYIYLITDNQVPSYVDINKNSKLKIIDHRTFIPEEYLPTFNSNVIELNVYRIKGLSEHFILMNDDMLFTNKLYPEDFFKNESIVDSIVFSPILPRQYGNGHIVTNDSALLNTYFSKRDFVKNNFFKVYNIKYGKRLLKNILLSPYRLFSGFYDYHIPIAYKKSVYKKLLENEANNKYLYTCRQHFRSEGDINHWLVRYWQLMTEDIIPRADREMKYLLLDDVSNIQKALNSRFVKMICINDTNECVNYTKSSRQVLDLLEQKFPIPCSFEKEL